MTLLKEILNEYLNPVYYITVLFNKKGKSEVKRHEDKADAYDWASDLPSVAAVIVAKNRDKKTTRISRADFNTDVPKNKQAEFKKSALELANK